MLLTYVTTKSQSTPFFLRVLITLLRNKVVFGGKLQVTYCVVKSKQYEGRTTRPDEQRTPAPHRYVKTYSSRVSKSDRIRDPSTPALRRPLVYVDHVLPPWSLYFSQATMTRGLVLRDIITQVKFYHDSVSSNPATTRPTSTTRG